MNRHVKRLFSYEQDASIRCYIDGDHGNLGVQIERHGATLVGAHQDPDIHIGTYAGAIVLPVNPEVPIIRSTWFLHSMAEGRLQPLYEYIDGKEPNPLLQISPMHRDTAAILMTMVGCWGDWVYTMLHRQYPHHTIAGWRRRSYSSLQILAARIRPGYQQYVTAQMMPMLPPAVLATPISPISPPVSTASTTPPAPNERLSDNTQPQTNTQRQENDEFMDEMETKQPQYGDNAQDNILREPSQAAASPVPPWMEANSVNENPPSSEQAEIYEIYDDDDDSDYQDSDMPVLRPPALAAPGPQMEAPRPRRRIPVEQIDFDNMARFIAKLRRVPNLADWEEFRTLARRNEVRSANAWSAQYYTSWVKLQDAAIDLGLQIHLNRFSQIVS